MAAELVNSATSDKLTETDWMKNIKICELVAHDHRQAKDVIKAIKKRLGSKSPTTQLFAVTLLEMLMNNIGDPVHKQVIDTGILPVLVKIVKKKSDVPVREKIFLLLDAAQTSVGGASGRFPQYYSAYYELVSAGVKFPERPNAVPKEHLPPSNDNRVNPCETKPSQLEKNVPEAEPQKVSDSSILHKANAALEVLRDVLDAVDIQHPEGARDEFTLDLVEQCSFQKQRVMHLAMTSRDEMIVSRAVELNEQLDTVLKRHDALLAAKPTGISTRANYEQSEEEEPEQLFRRMRKGKALLQPEDEDRPSGLVGASIPGNMLLHRPLIRPVSSEQQKQERDLGRAAAAIPPPPAKHAEREKFFQENKSDGSALSGHMRGLSLHSRNASSSRSGSMDFSD
nr:TOM1-like protein 2 isoform X1 [Ipomoea batatas]GME16681.1 TOM1-like protein 2 isoform X1 [Ipomoea batatas]